MAVGHEPLARPALAEGDDVAVGDGGVRDVEAQLPRLRRLAADPEPAREAVGVVGLEQPVRLGERERAVLDDQHVVIDDLDHRRELYAGAPVSGQLRAVHADGGPADVVDARAVALGEDLELLAREVVADEASGVDDLPEALAAERGAHAADAEGDAGAVVVAGDLADAPGLHRAVRDGGGEGRGGGRGGGRGAAGWGGEVVLPVELDMANTRVT